MDEKFTELKKARADLVKSCEQFYLKCTKDGKLHRESLHGDAKGESGHTTLSDAEMQELVSDVCMVDHEDFSE